MCGILGGNIDNWDYEKGILAIKHRGPDAQRVVSDRMCTLAFARLSIMDLSMNAMQPMNSEDGSVTILFNGEIYGFRKLRDRLKAKYTFKTTSDTEVILNAYMEYGDKFIDLIDGMFAIVIYDRRREILKIYRDRYGIKPLYYYSRGGDFAFASEIKAITEAAGNRKWKVDKTAVIDYLCYQYVPEPKSIYEDIRKLSPACYIFYDLREKRIVKKGKYWKLNVCTRAHGNRKRDDVLEDIRYLIAESVRQQMVADVEVGTFLSGGIDSSIITYESIKNNNNTTAYSIGFKEKQFDESYFSKIFAERYHINQKIKIVTAKDVLNLKGKLRDWYDEPFADTSAYPTYIVSSFARENVKVVLTGDGGDEIFGGYGRYKLFCDGIKEGNTIQNKNINKFVDSLHIKESFFHNTQLDVYSRYVGKFDKALLKSWCRKYGVDRTYDPKWYLKKYYVYDLPPLTRVRYLDFKTYLPSDILTKVDRTSMSVSLEARVPFLNREIVEYVFELAEDECCSAECLKQLLKEAYNDAIPFEILYRKKKGFAIPNNYMSISSRTNTLYEEILRKEWLEIFNQ